MEQQRVRVEVLGGRDLPAGDSNGLSDPFVWVYYNNACRRSTSVIYKTLNPTWDSASFDFHVQNDALDTIRLIVWDKDPVGKDFLGEAFVPINVVAHKSDAVELWVPLLDKVHDSKKIMSKLQHKVALTKGKRGELHIRLTWLLAPAGGAPPARAKNEEERQMMTRSAVVDFRKRAEASSAASWAIPAEEIERSQMVAEGVNACVYGGVFRGQKVAIKVLKQALDPVQMKDFTTEFTLLRTLTSPWIVLFYGASISEDNTQLSMVFEFCANGSLQDVMKRQDIVFGWDRVFKFAIQAAEGLASLHNWKPPIIHRDVKSLNFLVDAFWNIKIADLGLARTDEATHDETLKKLRGTYHYSPPEAYGKGELFDAKSDVFSLTVVVWELVVRAIRGQYQVPYLEYGLTHDFQIIIKVSKENIRPSIPKATPAPLAALIEKCWDKDKGVRLSSMQYAAALTQLSVQYEQNREEWDAALLAEKASE